MGGNNERGKRSMNSQRNWFRLDGMKIPNSQGTSLMTFPSCQTGVPNQDLRNLLIPEAEHTLVLLNQLSLGILESHRS